MDTDAAFLPSSRKIDPYSKLPFRPDGTPADNDRVEIGPTAIAFAAWQEAGLDVPDLAKMRRDRLNRLTTELQRHDFAGLLCFDPLNIRYATDSTNMQLWTAHNPARACFVSADGHVVLWDYASCGHLTAHLPLIAELRTGASFFYMVSGDRVSEHAANFSGQVDELLRRHGGANRRLAIDRIEPEGLLALRARGIACHQGQPVTEKARAIKNDEELKAMRCAVRSCEMAMAAMQEALRPGMSENDLWAILHAQNIRHGGEWIETRLLASGPRTNPWFQECGPRVIQDGDIVAFDTDLIGVYGMCCDISRTWIAGSAGPGDEQKRLYRHAYEMVRSNMELIRPGMGFREFTHKAALAPQEYRQNRYAVLAHGVGLCDEWPCLYFPEDWPQFGFEGTFEPGMIICVESYCGEAGGREGVKLEQQVLVTECGIEDLTAYPFETRFLD